MSPRITIVIPVFNEEAVIRNLAKELAFALKDCDFCWSVLFVNDGSTDQTLAQLKAIYSADRRFTAISLSRNFGKENAVAAGLHCADGDAVVLMDGDLQHPPSTIPVLVKRWREGYKVVFGQRQSDNSEKFLRTLSSRVFHVIFRRIAQPQLPVGIADFLLLDRNAVDAFNQFGERTRFSKGLYAWIGFPSTSVPFTSSKRLSSTSRWRFLDLVRFAFDGLISFSNLPLKIWSYVGAFVSVTALVYAGYTLVSTLIVGTDVPGFPSLFVSIMFFAGVQLISLGVIGEYLARIYEEVKGRPLYVIAEAIGTVGIKREEDREE